MVFGRVGGDLLLDFDGSFFFALVFSGDWNTRENKWKSLRAKTIIHNKTYFFNR